MIRRSAASTTSQLDAPPEDHLRWEAIRNGKVIARAGDLDELVRVLAAMGARAAGAEARFVESVNA